MEAAAAQEQCLEEGGEAVAARELRKVGNIVSSSDFIMYRYAWMSATKGVGAASPRCRRRVQLGEMAENCCQKIPENPHDLGV